MALLSTVGCRVWDPVFTTPVVRHEFSPSVSFSFGQVNLQTQYMYAFHPFRPSP